MATLHKNKNILQKLPLPMAVVVTAVYFFGCWYAYFYAASTETAYYFNTYVKYLLWVIYEVVFLFSFSANNATEFARHVMYYKRQHRTTTGYAFAAHLLADFPSYRTIRA
ncbi:MAG: hypothetical protein ACI4JA_06120 [Oscillospiraceae bacterium]